MYMYIPALRKKEERMIQVFELWLWRRYLRVYGRDRKTINACVREPSEYQRKKGLVGMVKKRKLAKHEHWSLRQLREGSVLRVGEKRKKEI